MPGVVMKAWYNASYGASGNGFDAFDVSTAVDEVHGVMSKAEQVVYQC